MELGEAGIYGALAGAYGVPVLMGSGDDAFIEETRPAVPQAVYVQTKRATGQGSGISLSPALACSAIRTGVAQGCAAACCLRSWQIEGPMQVEIQTQTPRWPTCFVSGPPWRVLMGTCCNSQRPIPSRPCA